MWVQAEAAEVARLLVWRLWGGQAGLGASYWASWGNLQLGPAGPVCAPDLACTKAMSLSNCHCKHREYTRPDRGSVDAPINMKSQALTQVRHLPFMRL